MTKIGTRSARPAQSVSITITLSVYERLHFVHDDPLSFSAFRTSPRNHASCVSAISCAAPTMRSRFSAESSRIRSLAFRNSDFFITSTLSSSETSKFKSLIGFTVRTYDLLEINIRAKFVGHAPVELRRRLSAFFAHLIGLEGAFDDLCDRARLATCKTMGQVTRHCASDG